MASLGRVLPRLPGHDRPAPTTAVRCLRDGDAQTAMGRCSRSAEPWGLSRPLEIELDVRREFYSVHRKGSGDKEGARGERERKRKLGELRWKKGEMEKKKRGIGDKDIQRKKEGQERAKAGETCLPSTLHLGAKRQHLGE